MHTSVDVGRNISKPAYAATAPYLRLRSSGGNWVISGATDKSQAIAASKAFAANDEMTGVLLAPGAVMRMASAGSHTIAVDDPIWGVASGLVDNTYTIGAEFLGFAQTAAAATAGALLEVLVQPARTVTGQSTTVAASDTIVTGLAKVIAVVATLDSDPVDDPEWVSASIGDQAGTPAAGSFLLKTWKNTGGTDPTPAAATTFSKKVNWVAIGY
jgi:hypothetical protein